MSGALGPGEFQTAQELVFNQRAWHGEVRDQGAPASSRVT